MIFHSFTVANFRSIREPLTLTMEAADLPGPSKLVDEKNLIKGPDTKYLKVKALFGGNAAGKTNIYKALYCFHKVIVEEAPISTKLKQYIEPFKLVDGKQEADTFFEIVLSDDVFTYRFGFEVNMDSFSDEWLYVTHNSKKTPNETKVYQFSRKHHQYYINKEYFTKNTSTIVNWFENLRDNKPMSEKNIGGQVNLTEPKGLGKPVNFIFNELYYMNSILIRKIKKCIFDIGLTESLGFDYYDDTFIKNIVDSKETKEFLVKILRFADVNILDLGAEPIKGANGDINLSFVFTKSIFNKKGQRIGTRNFSLSQESAGTKKLFFIGIGLALTLRFQKLLIIDELDARFHPLLTNLIVEIFQNKQTNPKGSQLIFITHDTQFLSLKKFRPDQIAFVFRNKVNATKLSTLIEFDGIDSDTDVRELYINGQLDGVPHLNLFLESLKP